MLLKRRPPGISTQASDVLAGFEHLEPSAIAVLRWLNANKIDYVLVGPVARAIRGEAGPVGPVAIVPAPYGRNWERLCTALVGERAGLRAQTGGHGPSSQPMATSVKLTVEKLARGRRWLLRCGSYDLDIEGLPLPEGASDSASASASAPASDSADRTTPGYQELLYESGRFEIAGGVSVEVAAPEDLEHYSHVRRTGSAPEFRVMRTSPAEHRPA